jgi:hypothetical protein
VSEPEQKTSGLGSLLSDEADPQRLPARREPDFAAGSDEHGSIVAIMTGARRTGTWEPPESLHVYGIMGGVDLDFREAEFFDGVTEVVVVAVMGGVNIVAPRGADVDSNGFALVGDFTHLTHRSPHADAPTLRIRGFSLMGGVKVKVKV